MAYSVLDPHIGPQFRNHPLNVVNQCMPLQYSPNEFLFGFKVMVNQPVRYPCFLGDIFCRARFVAFIRKNFERGVD